MQTNYHRTLRDNTIQSLPDPKKGSWINIVGPDASDLLELESLYSLEADLLDDGIDLYEAPRLERVEGTVYIYVRYCRPHGTHTSTHPLLIVVTANNVLTVTRSEAEPLQKVIANNEAVTTQKVRLVLEILEEVNMGYRRHLNFVTKRILSTRDKLKKTLISNNDVINFIDIEEDLNEFLAALQPYGLVLQALMSGKYMRIHEEDEDLIEDLQLSASELIELTKSRLNTIQNIREAYTAIATNNLNQIFKRLTSIAIFMSVPTIVGGFYGMNVALPYDHHPHAFWIVSSITLGIMILFILYFKRKRWL